MAEKVWKLKNFLPRNSR